MGGALSPETTRLATLIGLPLEGISGPSDLYFALHPAGERDDRAAVTDDSKSACSRPSSHTAMAADRSLPFGSALWLFACLDPLSAYRCFLPNS